MGEPTETPSPKLTHATSADLLSLLINRRSYYNLNSTSPIPDSRIQTILTKALQTVPSAFNIQSTRLVLLVGPAHHKLWDITTQLLREHMGEERWSTAPTAKKMAGFRGAHGTVLFYEDAHDVAAAKQKFTSYADKFDSWADQSSGMHQLAVWVALEAEGLGATVQHYNPLVDADVAREFGLPGPDEWVLKTQMVFGGVDDGKRPAEKEKKDTSQTLRVFGVDGGGN